MKNTAFVAVVLAACFAGGCATHSKDEAAPPPKYMTQAVLKSFENVFSGSWGGVKIYIERNAFLPGDLKKVGMNEVEMTDHTEMFKRYEFENNAPAIAVVNAWETSDHIIHTHITYQALKLKYARQSVKGGVFEHTYKIQDGNLIMLTSSKSME